LTKVGKEFVLKNFEQPGFHEYSSGRFCGVLSAIDTTMDNGTFEGLKFEQGLSLCTQSRFSVSIQSEWRRMPPSASSPTDTRAAAAHTSNHRPASGATTKPLGKLMLDVQEERAHAQERRVLVGVRGSRAGVGLG
jgi:hypothetical protein